MATSTAAPAGRRYGRPGRRRESWTHGARLCALLALGLLLAAVTPAHAQFFAFGQNKIQYRKLDWRVIKGPHVDLYYYPAESELAAPALAYAEASYDTLSVQFGHTVASRIPMIVYASHTDFEQTNILPFTPPEGLLGATDFLKRRVALPFRGNFAEFRHTMRHEMVHVFQLDLLVENYNLAPRASRYNFPLWWTEGLAELWSGGQDARDEMVMRDLTLSGKLPPIKQLTYVTGGIVYPIGGQLHRWLADTYGDWRPALMYKEVTRHETFEAAIQAVYGRTLDQLSDEFQLAMRRQYYPSIDSLAPLSVLGTEVARLGVKAVTLADTAGADQAAQQVAYLSPASGYVSIYRKSLDASAKAHAVVTGGRSAELESFHPFESRMDGSRPGLLLFIARYGDRDALIVWDLERRRAVGRYQFLQLVSLLSPHWMPDGQSIVVSGLSENGLSDLYRVHLPGGELEPLTADRYQDLDPSPSADGRRLVFASDRTADGRGGAVNLFVLDLQAGTTSQLTSGEWVDESPIWAPDGRIYFTSDRDGVLNVFSVDSAGAGRRETSAWTGAFDAVPLAQGGLLVGGFHDLSWNVYRIPVDSAARQRRFAAAPVAPAGKWTWEIPGDTATGIATRREPYRRRLTLDFAAGDAVVIPGYGGAQGLFFVASDLLGDNLLFGSLSSYQGRRLGSIFSNLSGTAIYLNRSRRVNWGVGAFRTRSRNFEGDRVVAYDETAYGAIGLLRYPLTRFTRVEGTVVLEHSDRLDFTLPVDNPRRQGWLASHYLSYVRDNALWINSGPIDGGRLALTAGLTSDFSNSRFDSYLVSGDWRRYLRLGRRSAWALRAYGFYSGGDRPRRINLGGTLGLRGYPQFGYIVGSEAFMFNQEVRVPLFTHLTFGTPFGDLDLPEIQAGLFTDVGQARFSTSFDRALIGSYGVSFRMALGPLTVLRLDVGRRFSSDNFQGYSLSAEQKRRSFVSFFFGYNY